MHWSSCVRRTAGAKRASKVVEVFEKDRQGRFGKAQIICCRSSDNWTPLSGLLAPRHYGARSNFGPVRIKRLINARKPISVVFLSTWHNF